MQPPRQFKTVKQPVGSLCCVACVAAIAVGKPLDYATDRMHATLDPEHGRGWYRMTELLAFLGAHGILIGAIARTRDGQTFNKPPLFSLEVDLAETFAILAVRSRVMANAQHLVFWDGRNVRDPSPIAGDVEPLHAYEVFELYPLCYVGGREDRRSKFVPLSESQR